MQITIIGCGNMGGSIATRLSKTHSLHLYSRTYTKAKVLEDEGIGKAYQHVKEAIEASEITLLAVKPQNLKEVAAEIGEMLKPNQILFSLLGGVKVSTLKSYFPTPRIIRLMPNLALIHGEGIAGLSLDNTLPREQKEEIEKTFESLGKIYWLPEEKIDPLTALVSSGPAFFFAMVEGMIEAGVKMNFKPEDSRDLVYQMLKGGMTLLESGKTPLELTKQIASPNGTTVAGLKKAEELSLKDVIIKTFLACYERAKELSKV